MGLGDDQLEALAECIDLINTGRRLAGGTSAADELADIRGVVAFARRYRVENRSAVRASDVPRLRELRARLDAIVVAREAGREERAIRDLNALLAETGAVPRIVTHDGRPAHIHVSSATAPLADRIAAHSAMGLAELIVAGESGRVRTCASPRCDVVFIDMSRNQSRRYCDSRTCGNRLHVAAYRSRQSASAPSEEQGAGG
ncbi:MAG TPA: CGNR zinc finger domain-containing protein [Streptosporangiaceae bacterium]|nr:CGNR zinc finger domain-containing protein [Streptosporangiaceae bacterium]